VNASDEVLTKRDGEVDLFALWRTAWKSKGLITIVTVACGALAAAYALLATPMFRAQVVVTVAEEMGMSGGGALASQLGGLASLAGVNIGGAAGAEREARAVLKSRKLVEEFITRDNLRPTMGEEGRAPPSLWGAVKRFQESVLDIREDQRQGTTAVSMEWTDAATAARWANEFVALANELIRKRAIDESERNIAYLNAQSAQTNVIEIRNVMYNLIEGETKKLMIANGRAEYAFKIVDPGVAPEIRAKPRRTMIVSIGLVVGLLLGTILAVSRNSWRTVPGR
jgi:uncharacterized protein involved in exopolysaccharide biosynthesis